MTDFGHSLKHTRTTGAARATMASLLGGLALCLAVPLRAAPADRLVSLVNDYRAAPGSCGARPARPLAPLVPQPALAGLTIPTGALLDQVLERAGYPVAQAEAIYVSGAADAPAALAAITRKHCQALLNPQFVAAGATRSGDTWLLILAQPAPPARVRKLPERDAAAAVVLAAVNAARAVPRRCGDRHFDAAPPLAWNAALAQAALAHSEDMAGQRFFSHQGKDGRAVAQRATQALYRWRLVGENIAAGMDSAEEAVAGWLDSPGHCANIMNPNFTEMGAAFAIAHGDKPGRVYWTQVLGAPR